MSSLPIDIPDLSIPGSHLYNLTPTFGSPYDALVWTGSVWKESRYFAERWAPTFAFYRDGVQAGPKRAGKEAGHAAWTIVALRQAIYSQFSNLQQPVPSAGVITLQFKFERISQETGTGERKLRALLKEELVQWFVQYKHGKKVFVSERSRVEQEQGTYAVRMDTPLVPADVEHLHRQLAAVPVTADSPAGRIAERFEWALSQPRDSLLASNLLVPLAEPDWFTAGRPVTLMDIWQRLEPELQSAPPEVRLGVGVRCEDLMQHLMPANKSVIDTHYFRKKWVPRLGPGPAWTVVILRSYLWEDNKTGQHRDEWRVPSYAWLADRVGVRSERMRLWIESGLAGFVRILDSRKGPALSTHAQITDPQNVSHLVWVSQRDPLIPEDQVRYEAELNRRLNSASSDDPDAPDGTPDLPDGKPTESDGEVMDPQTPHGDSRANAPSVDAISATDLVTEREPSHDEQPREKEGYSGCVTATKEPYDVGVAAKKEGYETRVTREREHYSGGVVPKKEDYGNAVAREKEAGAGGSRAKRSADFSSYTSSPRTDEFSVPSQNHTALPTKPSSLPMLLDALANNLDEAHDDGLKWLLTFLSVQGRNRDLIIKAAPTVRQVWGWALQRIAAGRWEKKLPGYLVNRFRDATRHEDPPDPYGAIAGMNARDWKRFAAAGLPTEFWNQSTAEPVADSESELFDQWMQAFGQLRLDEIPFGLATASQGDVTAHDEPSVPGEANLADPGTSLHQLEYHAVRASHDRSARAGAKRKTRTADDGTTKGKYGF